MTLAIKHINDDGGLIGLLRRCKQGTSMVAMLWRTHENYEYLHGLEADDWLITR